MMPALLLRQRLRMRLQRLQAKNRNCGTHLYISISMVSSAGPHVLVVTTFLGQISGKNPF